MTTDSSVGLRDAAAVLGVHYMTVYRYVRTGRLEAVLEGGEWRIEAGVLERERQRRTGEATLAGRPPRSPKSNQLVGRLVAGDEAGAHQLLESALASGHDPSSLYLELLGPALRSIGERWAAGALDVADEHRASAIALRLIGRLGPLFRPRGRRRGTVVIGAATGDPHAIPSAMVADLVRARGYEVVDLGADVPPRSFATASAAARGLRAVAIVVSDASCVGAVAEAVAAVREAGVTVPVLAGGSGMDPEDAAAAGADRYTSSATELLEVLAALAPRGSRVRSEGIGHGDDA